MRRMRICPHAGIWISQTITVLHHWRHFFQVDLVHDAVARRDHIDIFKCGFGPFDEVKTVFITTVFNGTVFLKSIRIKSAVFHSQRMIDNELSWHHRIDFRRVATLLGNGITQACKIDQSGLSQNIVTHHTGRIPREIQILTTFDNLR